MSIRAVRGDGQIGIAGHALASYLFVAVADAEGNGVPGITISVAGVSVAWAAASGGGTVDPAQSVTSADGNAAATATLGAKAGANTFTVAAAGLAGSPVTFSAVASP